MYRTNFVSPGGRGSGCHFRPAVGVRLGCHFRPADRLATRYRANFIRISVGPHKFHQDFSCTAQDSIGLKLSSSRERKASQLCRLPAVQAASCAAASRLCRHSAQTHTPYNASVLSRVCKQICATMVGCWLNCASELSAHDACAQRPPAGASARIVSPTPS